MAESSNRSKRTRDATLVDSTYDADKPRSITHSPPTQQEPTRRQVKRHKKKLTDDLVCPITWELPFDPVFAQDGRVYDKPAIEQHIEYGKRNGEVRSPITNEPMSQLVFPAPQIKNVIETMIENGLVEEALLEPWNKRVQEQQVAQALLRRAEAGDANAMALVGNRYLNGKDGFKKDAQQAYTWCKRAHEAGSIYGTGRLGYHLARGIGAGKNTSEGTMYLGIAAGQGSDYAAYLLGRAFAEGKFGLVRSPEKALEWLRRCLDSSCPFQHLNDEMKQRARELFHELHDEEDEDDDDDEDDSDFELLQYRDDLDDDDLRLSLADTPPRVRPPTNRVVIRLHEEEEEDGDQSESEFMPGEEIVDIWGRTQGGRAHRV